MNRIYKVIWSKVKNCYVVASELAKSHTKGCSGKRAGRILAAGAVAAGLILPIGDVEAFSSSYVPSYSSSSGYGSMDYQTDGGHVDVSQIGGYEPNWGYHYMVYTNADGTVDFFKNENYQKNDISSMIGNVAIGNFAEAGSAADAKMVNFYQYSSYQVAYEVKPEDASGNWYSVTYNGKEYWYPSSSSYRTYAYNPTYNFDGSVIEKDGKYYHQIQDFEPELDEEGNPKYDPETGYPLGKTVSKFSEIGSKIWKQDPANPYGNLVIDYKKTETDEYGNVRPVFDLTAEDLGFNDDNPYGYTGGTNNVAVGNKSKTISHSSVAVGDTSTARGWRSIAIGAQSEAGADPETTYVGSWNDGTSAVAVGNSARAYGSTSVAVGNGAATYSFSGIAVGNNSNASTEYSIAIGDNARIAYIDGAADIEQQRSAAQSIAIGRDAKAQAKDVTAVGRNAQGMMRNATAYGNNAHANAWNSIAIGNKATAGLQADIVNEEDGTAKDGTIGNSAVAIGNRARAEAEYTTAIGAGTWAEGWHAVAVGDSNRATGRFSTAIGAGWSINHTEGEPDSDDATDGSDAINTEGNRTYDSFGANQAGGDYSSAVGYGNMTVGTQSNAFGKENKVSGLSSLGVGAGNEVGTVAVGDNNVLEKPEDQENTVSGYAVGSYNKITGTEGTNAGAFGANNTVAGDNAYAMGNGNEITEASEKGIAIGNGNTVDGARSIAIGDGHTVTGENNTVIGDPNTVEGDDNQVLANKSTVTGDRNIAIGNEVTVEANDGVAIGTSAQATVDGGVALGSTSVAKREAANGGAGAGYDVLKNGTYEGEGADKPTWVSTLAAVSVGGTADDTDAEIGTAATATRQITGVAAGTADTDAVNVAQLRRATLKTIVTSTDNSVAISAPEGQTLGEPDENGVITFDLSVVGGGSGGGATYTGEQTTESGEGPGEGSTTYTLTGTDGSESSMNIKAGDNVTIYEDGDAAVIKAENTTYAGEQTTEEGEGPGEGSTTFTLAGSDGSKSRMNIKAGKNVTITKTRDAAVINAENTTYEITKKAGKKGTNVVNEYTLVGSDGKEYPFQDTDTTYTFETDRKKEGTVAATFTVKNEKTGKKVGEFQDTHNGLKNDTNEVKYDDNGEGSVTITDQDGNTTTITGIRSGGDMETINRLGDQISRMDSKIEKVGAGAAALAGLHPLDFDPDEKWDFAAAVGSYKSERAVAIGAFYRPNEDTMFSIGGTIGNGNNMVNVGVSWKFGQKNRISANRISSAKEIIELRKNQEDVHSFLADAVAGNQLDLSKIQLFPDVEENHWAYDYVATMAGNGVLEGYPDGYFKGNRNMTRYEMAAVLYRLMQNGARLSDRALTEFAPELDRIRVDTITHHKDGTPHIQRVRTIKERVDEKSDLSPEKAEKKKAKIKVAEKPVE